MAKADLTAQRLRELLHYNPDTGSFWKLPSGRSNIFKAPRCRLLGNVNATLGYVFVGVSGVRHYAHRLAWLYMTGAWPSGEIDHINGIRHDNRWANLRDVSRSWNAQNMRRNRANSSGLLGVSRVTPGVRGQERRITKKWTATIKVGGKRTYLGIFDTPEEAHAAYVEAKRRLHPGGVL